MISLPDFFDPDYTNKLNIFDRQQKALRDNTNHFKFNEDAINSWIESNKQNRTLNLPITPKPVLYAEVAVSDDGAEFRGPFEHQTPLVLPEQVTLQNPGTGFFGADPSKVPSDRLDQVIGMLRTLRSEQIALETRLVAIVRELVR